MPSPNVAEIVWPFVTIAVPALNEGAHIETCLQSLLTQDYAGPFEVLVLDGGSRDETCAMVRRVAETDQRVRLVHNPARLQSAACNLAAEQAAAPATVLLRADAHSGYARDFLRLCVTALRTKDVTSVVVPMHAHGAAGLQRIIAATQNSRLGNGGSAHRQAGRSGEVEHGHHAAFDLAFFRDVGGYDPSFSHNEDAELDHRMRRAGGRLWMCGEATITYFPRDTWRGLARQYTNHGRGRARTLLTHRLRPRLRQMAPVAFLLSSIGGIALAPVSAWFALMPAGYGLMCMTLGLAAAVRSRDAALLLTAPVAMVMHLSWAVGVVRTVVTWPLPGRATLAPAETLS